MKRLEKSLEDWRKELSDEQFQVCRLGGTERAFTGKYYATKTPGTYHCVCCDAALFDSEAKYSSGCGWPSYFQPVDKDAVSYTNDFSHGMYRVEIKCACCDAHLGHMFPDGPDPTGKRYCVNSTALILKPRE